MDAAGALAGRRQTLLPNADLDIVPGTDALWFTDSHHLFDRAIAFLAVR